jgi:hypothetical protein
MSPKLDKPVRIWNWVKEHEYNPCFHRPSRRQYVQPAGCILQWKAGNYERWVRLSSRGVNFCEVSPRSWCARPQSCAHQALWGSAPDFVSRPRRFSRGRPLRTLSPCCSTRWSVDSPKPYLARGVFQRKLKTPSRPGIRLAPKPESQRCGSLGLGSGLEGRRPDPSKSCPPKRGPDWL